MLVIYKDMVGYCVTSEENYNAFIRDARMVNKLYDFETPDEIIEYYHKYCHEDKSNFKVISN